MPATVLIVEDEKNTREGLLRVLEDDYDVYEACDAEQAFRLMEEEAFDVVLTDLRMAGKDGLSVIDKAMKLRNRPTCIMMTAYGSVETAVEAMKRGAYDFLTKPVNLEKLELVIRRGLQARTLEVENEHLHQRLDEKYQFTSNVLGESGALMAAVDQIKQVAPSKATVLLCGETGTGKELFSQMIHQNSPRARKPFVAVHCAALPANLLESELFGHEKGAFTGAVEKRIGRFESANDGTLFLDEIGEIDASTQVKLLRFLETKEFERVGSTKTLKVDVRLVCATNRNLEEMVKKGDFREDLFYRLNVVKVELPSLRDRQDDIPVLLNHFVDFYAKENGVPAPLITAEAMEVLTAYKWPGNIRELRNYCENVVVMKSGQKVTEYDLDSKFTGSAESIASKVKAGVPLKEAAEKDVVMQALREAKGNRTKAAEMLGMSRRTLYRKLDKWADVE